MSQIVPILRRTGLAVSLLIVAVLACATPHPSFTSQAYAQASTDVLGTEDQSQMWRAIRKGESGTTSVPNANAGQLIQSEGDNWRAIRNGPLSVYGAQVIIGMILLLAVFFLIRGRIKIDHGLSGWTVERFSNIDRFAHWLLAGSFLILGLTGLNVLYGRYILPPIIGAEAFGLLTSWGKYAHNYVAFAFMIALPIVFLLWVRHNIPNRADVTWVLKGGGILGTSHPPARKFNFGQKIIFWLVIVFGLSISLSGIALLFPFQTTLFSDTFAFLNRFGLDLPTNLTPLQEMQFAQVWHAIVSLLMVAVIIAHIYIGTIGMQGAFDAMGTGRVDLNWAKEHHSLWVEELDENDNLHLERAPDAPREVQPAE